MSMQPEECVRMLIVELGIEEARYAATSRHCETFAAECAERNPRFSDYLQKRARFAKQLARDTAAFRDLIVADEK